MRRKTAQPVGEQAFQRDYWSMGRQSMRVSLRILQLKRDVVLDITKVHGGDIVGATFTPQEIDLLRRVAGGEVIGGLDLPQHIAEAQLRWIAAGGKYVSEDEGA